MSEVADNVGAGKRSQWPAVNRVSMTDLLEAVAAGLGDFRRAAPYGLAIAAVYALGGWLLVLMLVAFDLHFLVYPLAAGFALVAPFIACGFYAISLCLEQDKPLSWAALRHMVGQAARRDLGWMALVTGFCFFVWMDIAALLFFGFMGLKALSTATLLEQIFTTPSGLMFLVVGNAAGAVIALGVFSISVTSFPMLFERNCDFVTAMVTSARVVLASPKVMVVWCIMIAALMGLSFLSGLVGLFVVLPALGHASWHLYRRAVAPAGKAAS